MPEEIGVSGALLLSLLLLVLMMILHYWMLWFLQSIRSGHPGQHGRSMMLVVSLAIIHAIYILLYAVAYSGLLSLGLLGGAGAAEPSFTDLLYISAVSFTTLGLYHDELFGAFRILAGFEALAGFMVLTWSTAFIYSIFKTDWRY